MSQDNPREVVATFAPSDELAIRRPVAELRVRGTRGVFVATDCWIEAPFVVHAAGRWRRRLGLNYADVDWSGPRRYTWPSGAVVCIRWLDAATDPDVEAAAA